MKSRTRALPLRLRNEGIAQVLSFSATTGECRTGQEGKYQSSAGHAARSELDRRSASSLDPKDQTE